MKKVEKFRTSLGISEVEFKLSHGWFCNFKSRNGIASHYLHGEFSNAEGVRTAISKVPEIMKPDYIPDDMFNFDEIGLYYRAPPARTLNIGKAKGLKKKKD